MNRGTAVAGRRPLTPSVRPVIWRDAVGVHAARLA